MYQHQLNCSFSGHCVFQNITNISVDEDSDDGSNTMPLSNAPNHGIPSSRATVSLPRGNNGVPCVNHFYANHSNTKASREASVLVARGLKEKCNVTSVLKQGRGDLGQMHYGSTKDLHSCARQWKNNGQGKSLWPGVILNDAKAVVFRVLLASYQGY